MKKIMSRVTPILVGLCAVFLLAGCHKTENLSQEVLLNTGEKIIVHWTVDYEFSLQADSGSLGMHPKLVKTLDFDYAGKHYRYHGDAGVFLMAISPEGRPTLVLHPNSFAWNWKNRYQCTTPYYAQLNPDDSGEKWDFPPSIEPWLYGLRGNLSERIFSLPSSSEPRGALETIKEEYSSEREDRKRSMFVDPDYTTTNCIKGDWNDIGV